MHWLYHRRYMDEHNVCSLYIHDSITKNCWALLLYHILLSWCIRLLNLFTHLVGHSNCLYINMERINRTYSLKNIRIPTKSSYQLKLINHIENLIKRSRWKRFFFLWDNCDTNKTNNNDISESEKETFGFKSKQRPVQINKLESFEKDLLDMIKSIQFRNVEHNFQTKMKNDISKIKSSPNVFVSVGKTIYGLWTKLWRHRRIPYVTMECLTFTMI